MNRIIENDVNIMSKSIDTAKKTSQQYLLQGYYIADGVIWSNRTQKPINDSPIDALKLDNRAYNALYRAKAQITDPANDDIRVSDIIALTPDKLSKIKNMGSKTSEAIISKVKEYLDEALSEYGMLVNYSIAPYYVLVDGLITHIDNRNIVPDVMIYNIGLSTRATSSLRRGHISMLSEIITQSTQQLQRFPNMGSKSLDEITEKIPLYLDEHLVDKEFFDKESERVGKKIRGISFPDVDPRFPVMATNYNVVDGVIYNINTYFTESVFEYLTSLKTKEQISSLDRSIRILELRLSGKTLEEVGCKENITRERVRQIEKKATNKLINHGKAVFSEDQYAYLFSTYALDKEFYTGYIDDSDQIWHYLNFRYSRGTLDAESALDDKKLPIDVRRLIDNYIHRGYTLIDNKYIPLRRPDIEDIVIEKYCKDDVTLSEFFDLYSRFLDEYDITDENLIVTDSIRRSRGNRLTASMKVLWKQNQRLRYYDIESGDYTELLDTLNLSKYTNIEISTRKFVIDYPELMDRYDLRDEYEVHNLLKKIHAETENPDLVFGRMPTLQFGTFDREAAVKEILFASAPVSQDELVELITLEYGIRANTIVANWLTGISEYYHQGIYSIDYEEMPDDHMSLLKSTLKEDFYYFNELREIYNNLVDNADLTLLSTFNLKRMGFLVGTTYVIQNYPTAEAFFNHILTNEDFVNMTPINKRFSYLSAFGSLLASIKNDLQIIEFEPFQYINIRRIEAVGYDKDALKEYSERVWSYLVDGSFFSLQSLRTDGFVDELDSLGFEDLFYNALLRESDRFTWQRMGGVILFNPQNEQFTVRDFLVSQIKKLKSVDINDFINDLSDRYGILSDRSTIIQKVKSSDVYYDSIMEKLYADYSVYFEEI